MATATTKSGAEKQPARRRRPTHRRMAQKRVPESVEFRIFEDNGGSYHWTIVAGDGAPLARSEGFASYHDAEQAAQRVRDAVSSARFERDATEGLPADLGARRNAVSDDAAAERWLDEGGSFSSETVAKWPASR